MVCPNCSIEEYKNAATLDVMKMYIDAAAIVVAVTLAIVLLIIITS